MSRNTAQWLAKPKLPPTHTPTRRSIPSPRSSEKIFKKVWWLACYESELPNPGDFRTYHHPGDAEVVIVRGDDMKVRTFFNICPHRADAAEPGATRYTDAGNPREGERVYPVNAAGGEGGVQSARIWYQSFVDPVAQEPCIRRLQQRLDDYAAPDVRYAVHGMSPPDRYLSPLTEFRCAARTIRSALQAEAEGYDAFVIGYLQEPGLIECRAAVDIPVIGLGEATMLNACTVWAGRSASSRSIRHSFSGTATRSSVSDCSSARQACGRSTPRSRPTCVRSRMKRPTKR